MSTTVSAPQRIASLLARIPSMNDMLGLERGTVEGVVLSTTSRLHTTVTSTTSRGLKYSNLEVENAITSQLGSISVQIHFLPKGVEFKFLAKMTSGTIILQEDTSPEHLEFVGMKDLVRGSLEACMNLVAVVRGVTPIQECRGLFVTVQDRDEGCLRQVVNCSKAPFSAVTLPHSPGFHIAIIATLIPALLLYFDCLDAEDLINPNDIGRRFLYVVAQNILSESKVYGSNYEHLRLDLAGAIYGSHVRPDYDLEILRKLKQRGLVSLIKYLTVVTA
ncbi:hypothetical protein DXG01_011014 [Tephrocybe rancida]|nr:hypothetical protein DXG01_011014 [Tephrocybe rancida]